MEYETNDEIRSYVRSLPALAFVPPDDVKEAFELLAESQPTTVDHLDARLHVAPLSVAQLAVAPVNCRPG